MKYHIQTICLIAFVILTSRLCCFCQCNRAQDSIALVTFYNSTTGNAWHNPWKLNTTIDTWFGVNLDKTGCVSRLNLVNNNLTGTLHEQIGNLSALRFLYISNNNLTGTIPSSLENLDELIILDLSFNQLKGVIPTQLGNLDNLFWLVLNNNQLTGSIPVELSNLSKLSNLALYENKLTGTIPKELSKLENLTDLFLGLNNLTGTLPASLANMPNLNNLYVANNHLSGCYAPELKPLCNYATSTTISDGNNFNVNWDEFCTFEIGICGGDNCLDTLNLTEFLTENNYQAKQTIQASTIIPASRAIWFIAGEEIQLNAEFQTQFNSTFNAIIKPCE